jgi:hypothetical protein
MSITMIGLDTAKSVRGGLENLGNRISGVSA